MWIISEHRYHHHLSWVKFVFIFSASVFFLGSYLKYHDLWQNSIPFCLYLVCSEYHLTKLSCSHTMFSVGFCACQTSLEYLWFSTLCLSYQCCDLVLIYIYIILTYINLSVNCFFSPPVKFVLNMWLMNPFWICYSVALKFFLVNFLCFI